MIRFIPLFLLILLFSMPVFADELIIEPEMGRQPLLQTLQKTRQSLDMVMYGMTDDELINAIIQQKNQGRSVKIILEEKPYKAEDQNNKAITTLKKYRIDWHGHIPPFKLIHQKTCIIDNKKALIMTFNLTKSSFKSERNFALLIDDPNLVREIKNVFSADWNHVPYVPSSSNLLYSPDNSRARLLAELQKAKKEIKIYAQSVNDYKVVGALVKLAEKGIHISILTSKKLNDKQASLLQSAGINIRYSKKYYVHAKVFIIDNNRAILGSINLTRASLDDNRELAVITTNTNVLHQLNATFAKDWQLAENSNSSASPYATQPHAIINPHLQALLIKEAKALVKFAIKEWQRAAN